MLPGVELARRRRVHYHGDVASSPAAPAAEHHHCYHAHAHHAVPAAGVAGPALAARIRLEGKLRGAAALPSTTSAASPSRWSRLMRDGRSTPPRHPDQSTNRRDEQDTLPTPGASPEQELWRPAPPPTSATLLHHAAAASASSASAASTQQRRRRRAELTRTLSKVDVCAVCLDEVRPDGTRRVTRLPCSHKYHSECVLPWLAVHPDCPCCRALVPSADTLVQVGDS